MCSGATARIHNKGSCHSANEGLPHNSTSVPSLKCYIHTYIHTYVRTYEPYVRQVYLRLNDNLDVLQSLAVLGGIKDLIKLLLQDFTFTEGPGWWERGGKGRGGEGREGEGRGGKGRGGEGRGGEGTRERKEGEFIL